LPLLEILHSPVVGFVSLAVVLTTLVARSSCPEIPGAMAHCLSRPAFIIRMRTERVSISLALPLEPASINPAEGLLPTEWLAASGLSGSRRFVIRSTTCRSSFLLRWRRRGRMTAPKALRRWR